MISDGSLYRSRAGRIGGRLTEPEARYVKLTGGRSQAAAWHSGCLIGRIELDAGLAEECRLSCGKSLARLPLDDEVAELRHPMRDRFKREPIRRILCA
jgi:hypothetical protein